MSKRILHLLLLLATVATISAQQCIDFTNLRGPNTRCDYADGVARYDNCWSYRVQYNYRTRRNDTICLGDDVAWYKYTNSYTWHNNTGPQENGLTTDWYRHWVINDPTMTDPRTLNQLYCVPPGEATSVRLGSPQVGGEAERIIYSYQVPTTNIPIIVIKYAIVMQNAGSSHEGENRPMFTLEVKVDGEDITNSCGELDFNTEDNIGWNYGDMGIANYEDDDVKWRDWSSVSIGLDEYAGKTLTLTFTTYDCKLGAHYGYAYINIGCISKEISTLACGGKTDYTTYTAPDGYDYMWYYYKNGITQYPNPSNQQSITVPMDSTTYYVQLREKSRPSCTQILQVTAAPRLPLADFQWEQKTGCVDTLYLTNKSYVSKDGSLPAYPLERVDEVDWDFGDGRTHSSTWDIRQVPIIYEHSGNYTITLTTKLDGGCTATTSHTFYMHGYGETHRYEYSAEACQKDGYDFNGEKLRTTGIYTATTKTPYGCDSTTVLHLKVYTTDTIVTEAQICSGESYEWEGNTFTTSRTERRTVQYKNNSLGCDSVVKILKLTVLPKYIFPIERVTKCSDELSTFTWHGMTFTQGGTYEDAQQTVAGCDSIYTLELTVNPTKTTNLPAIVQCSNQPLPFFNNEQMNTTKVYTWHGQTVSGCDSTVNQPFTLNPAYFHEINAPICEGQTYTTPSGKQLTTTGVYFDTLKTISCGCDSVFKINLTVNQVYHNTISEEICQGDKYLFHGTYYDQTGDYTWTNSSAEGCEITETLSLVVNSNESDITRATICKGESYNFHDFNYTEAGTYIWRGETATGCERKETLILTVNPVLTTELSPAICKGDSYDFDGDILTEEGNYTKKYTSVLTGCDSIVIVHLKVNPIYSRTIQRSICQGDKYTFHDVDYTESGTYTWNGTTKAGCDSIETLVLTVNPIQHNEHYETICEGDILTFCGKEHYTTGTYTYKYQNRYGCDSTEVLHLTVNPLYRRHIYKTICANESYEFNSVDYDNEQTAAFSTTGDYTWRGLTKNGCDSIITLHLTVNPVYSRLIEQSICQGDSYHFRNVDYTTDTEQVFNLKTENGCDSIVTFRLRVNPSYKKEIERTICQGDTVHFHNAVYDTEGTYYWNGITTLGCDSTEILKLTVNPVKTTIVPTHTICEGDYVEFEGEKHYNADEYRYTYSTAAGCDSIVVHRIVVNPVYTDTIRESICKGQKYSFHNHDYTKTDTITWSSTSLLSGCDSIEVLILTVNPTYRDTIKVNICEGSYYDFHDTRYTTSGFYTWRGQSELHCDSIEVLSLTVRPVYSEIKPMTICEGDTVEFHGQKYWEEGNFEWREKTAAGCDSVEILDLRINRSYHDTIYETICDNQGGFRFHSRTYYLQDTITWFGKTLYTNCDSTETLILNVMPSYDMPATIVERCDNQLPYIFYNQTITQTGNYSHTLQTRYSRCDSVINLEFHRNTTYLIDIVDTICEGESYIFGGKSYSRQGIYYDSLKTVGCGCDSVIRLTLRQRPRHFIQESVITCDNSPYIWHNKTLTETGIYYDSLFSINGCDSIHELTLTVNPSYRHRIKVERCENDPYVFYGQTLNHSGLYEYNIGTALGCDSIIELEYTQYPSHVIDMEVTICKGESYDFFGMPYTAEGIYEHHLSTVGQGCDSIYRLTLHVLPSYYIQETKQICDNEMYEWHGQRLNSTGIYYDRLYTKAGCDSIYELTLTVLPTYLMTEQATICDIDTYNFRGKLLRETGIYYDSLLTRLGCDSVFMLDLRVIPTRRDTTFASICLGDNYLFHGQLCEKDGIYYDSVCQPEVGLSRISVLYLTTVATTYISEATVSDACADDKEFSISYRYTGAKPITYSVRFDPVARSLGFEDVVNAEFTDIIKCKIPQSVKENYIRPDNYTIYLTFNNGSCQPELSEFEMKFMLKYPSWVIEQNWQDVVAVLNNKYNGGYYFDQFEWFLNGQTIDGEYMPYLYLPQYIHAGDRIHADLRRDGEDYSISTCPIVITQYSKELSDHPVLVQPNVVNQVQRKVTISSKIDANFNIYNSVGKLLQKGSITEGEDLQIEMPATSGCYLMQIIKSDNTTQIEKIIVE